MNIKMLALLATCIVSVGILGTEAGKDNEQSFVNPSEATEAVPVDNFEPGSIMSSELEGFAGSVDEFGVAQVADDQPQTGEAGEGHPESAAEEIDEEDFDEEFLAELSQEFKDEHGLDDHELSPFEVWWREQVSKLIDVPGAITAYIWLRKLENIPGFTWTTNKFVDVVYAIKLPDLAEYMYDYTTGQGSDMPKEAKIESSTDT